MSQRKTREQAFDLREYASGIQSVIPSYEELKRTREPEFRKFLAGLRERLKGEKDGRNRKMVFTVLGTGGTFQSQKGDEGFEPTGTLKESFDALGLPEDPKIHLELCDLMNLDSSQMTVEQWRFLAEMIMLLEETAGDMYDQIIVTHGTDTMAKGASYLSFMLKGFPKCIIFTGSQEPARAEDSDAKDQMEKAITAAKLACGVERRITEVMVACGLRVTRGTWAIKQGDKTVNAFGPWNQPTQGYDATDWVRAYQEDDLHRLAPALLDFGTGKSKGALEFASHAIDYDHKGPFEPFTEITRPADIFPATLSDKSPKNLAEHLVKQRVALFTLLGAATADDRLVDVVIAGAERGKIVIYEAPFPDSTVEPGTYKAGKGVRKNLSNIRRHLPLLNTSPDTFAAKSNFLIHKLGIEPAGETDGLGVYYRTENLREFYDHMEQNMVRELV